MSVLVTLVVSVAVLYGLSRLLWPQGEKPPIGLYVGTIAAAFFIGLMAGGVVDGKEMRHAAGSAVILAGLIAVVALVSWFKINPPNVPPARLDEPDAGGTPPGDPY